MPNVKWEVTVKSIRAAVFSLIVAAVFVLVTMPALAGPVEREIKIEKPYLNFPVKQSGERQRNPDRRLITFSIDGKRVREFDITLAPAEPDFWVFMDVREFKGKTATLRVNEESKGFDAVYQDDTFPGENELYKERLRPQLHFTSRRGWNNDPNGMMYYDGEYHLFYQHNPFGWPWGNMTWGHAVSTDLVHWKELGDALHPDELGTMFSGSGVVDWNNTTGFQTGDEPPMICIYTNAGGTNPWSEGEPFTQGIAYSNDRGRTWTKYEGNPVQGHMNDGNRDPKVIWWEDTEEWVIVLYLRDGRLGFFTSPNLKRWEFQSVLQSFHECPELFQLALDGDENNKKWILYGGAGDYFVGEFDGKKYTPDGDEIRFHYGDCFYASQTFSDIPEEDGRRIQIAWGQNPSPGMPFNQMMDFPVVLTLHSTDDGPRMFAYPVEEIEKLYGKEHQWKDIEIEPGDNPLSDIQGELFDIEVEFEVGDAEELGLVVRGVPVVYNVEDKRLVFGESRAPLRADDGKISLRCIVDRTSIEIFANNGRIYMPCRFRPQDNDKTLGVFAKGGQAKLTSLEVRELESIWK